MDLSVVKMEEVVASTAAIIHAVMGSVMVAAMMVLFHYKSNYIPLLGCRIAQRSAQYGWCSYSSFGLYSFGQSLMCVPQMADAGYAW